MQKNKKGLENSRPFCLRVVGANGVEPLTYAL